MRQSTLNTLDSAREIAGEYNGNLTVRQLYYQLVAQGFIANSQESYKRLVSILTDARLSGDFPFEWLLDPYPALSSGLATNRLTRTYARASPQCRH